MTLENDLKNWQIKLLFSCLTVINGNANQPFAIVELTNDPETEHYGYAAYWRAGNWSVNIEVEDRILTLQCSQLTSTPDEELGRRFYVFGNSEGDKITPWLDLYAALQDVKQWFHIATSHIETFKYGIKNQIEDLTKNL